MDLFLLLPLLTITTLQDLHACFSYLTISVFLYTKILSVCTITILCVIFSSYSLPLLLLSGEPRPEVIRLISLSLSSKNHHYRTSGLWSCSLSPLCISLSRSSSIDRDTPYTPIQPILSPTLKRTVCFLSPRDCTAFLQLSLSLSLFPLPAFSLPAVIAHLWLAQRSPYCSLNYKKRYQLPTLLQPLL